MDSARSELLDAPRKGASRYRFFKWLPQRKRDGAAKSRYRPNQAMLGNRIDHLAKYANDPIVLFDLSGKFIDANDRFLATYRYRRDEVPGVNINDLRPSHLRDDQQAVQQRLAARGGLVYETEHCTRDGRTIPVEISSRLIELHGKRFVQAIIRDISARRKTDARILTLSRLYAAISAASQAVVRAQTVQELFESVCRACVEHGGFRMAWIGLLEGDRIVPHASFGSGLEYLDGITERAIDLPSACEPQFQAYREQRIQVSANLLDDPAAAPWRERAALHGFHASIALPLCRASAVVGTLTAYAETPQYFDEEMESLLGELGETISFGMEHFDRDEKQRLAKEALRLNEARLLEAQAIGDIGDWVFDLSERKMKWSPQMYRLFERDPAAGPPNRDEIQRYYDAETARRLRHELRRAVDSGARAEIEQRVKLPSGREAYHATVIVPIRNGDGRITILHGTIQDITARKLAEEERAQLGRRMQELSQRLIAAQEDERRRLAAELHDRTSPNLAAIQATLVTVKKSMPDQVLAALQSQLDDLKALIEDTGAGIRDVCAELRPALLDYAGLVPALESHIEQFSKRTGVSVRFEHELEKRLPADVEALLFRISQEALTNCAKHANAQEIRIELRHRRNGTALSISDDGVGFDPAGFGNGCRKPGLGLLTMRERAEFAGGRLHIVSKPGHGTRISLEI